MIAKRMPLYMTKILNIGDQQAPHGAVHKLLAHAVLAPSFVLDENGHDDAHHTERLTAAEIVAYFRLLCEELMP